MKNKLGIISTILCCICFYTLTAAQGNRMSKKEFDELWNKADSSAKVIVKTGNVTKDMNAVERNNINSVDIKQKNVTNPNYKPIDTSNIKQFSSEPVIKGSSPKSKNTTISKEEVPVTPIVKDKVKTDTKKPIFKDDDFSTQPIVKGKAIKSDNSPGYVKSSKKPAMDTTKDFREFTFEGTPVINNNANYNRRSEPMPKTKEEIEDAIPVNRKPNNTNVNNDVITEAYAQYDKEADSMHTANKRVLDSVLKTLKIKVPVIINPQDYIDIYVSGGGLLTNSNSKIYDHISILRTGVVQREYKTKSDGVQRTEKKISRDELSKLAQYIVDMDFFNFNEDYDCADNDAACNGRLKNSPQPVPLDVTVTVGQKKNKVSVSIFAPKAEKNWVNYPATLEKIVNAIYAIVEK